jgi:hypothetical protein
VDEPPEPVVVVPPGSLVIVQEPDGNPLSTTLPVVTTQVGCVIAPIVGAWGAANTWNAGPVVSQLNEFLTVTVCEPTGTLLKVVPF